MLPLSLEIVVADESFSSLVYSTQDVLSQETNKYAYFRCFDGVWTSLVGDYLVAQNVHSTDQYIS